MTKFQHGEDPGFKAIADELGRWAKKFGVRSSAEVLGKGVLEGKESKQQQSAWCTYKRARWAISIIR
jgi:hypothetical protein